MKSISYIGLAMGLCTMIGLAMPYSAAAAEVTVNTAQVIPPGSSCTPLQVTNIHPYIVGNTLQSVDITVSDPSYVAVVASVGDTSYSFRYISRWHVPDGSVRQHLDVQTTPIGSSLPVTLTLLSGKPGQPICLSIVSFSVTGTGPIYVPHPPVTRVPPVEVPPNTLPGTGSTSTSNASNTVSVVRGFGFGTLSDMCTPSGSLQLWFLLITLYLVGAAVVSLREPTVPERPLTATTLLLLIPALALGAFWLMASTCRGADWVPVVLIVIAIASLLAALWERQPGQSHPVAQLSAPAVPKQIGPVATPAQIGAPRVTNWGK